MTTICSSCGDLLWSHLEIKLDPLCTIRSRERQTSHNLKCAWARRAGQLTLKDALSPTDSLHLAVMAGSLTCICGFTTLSVFVLHKNLPILDSQS